MGFGWPKCVSVGSSLVTNVPHWCWIWMWVRLHVCLGLGGGGTWETLYVPSVLLWTLNYSKHWSLLIKTNIHQMIMMQSIFETRRTDPMPSFSDASLRSRRREEPERPPWVGELRTEAAAGWCLLTPPSGLFPLSPTLCGRILATSPSGPVFWVNKEYGSVYSCLPPLGAREGVQLIPTPVIAPLIASEVILVGKKFWHWGDNSGERSRLEFFPVFWTAVSMSF